MKRRKKTRDAYPHPDDSRAWDELRMSELDGASRGSKQRRRTHRGADEANDLPTLEIPPTLTLRQWLDITETQPDP